MTYSREAVERQVLESVQNGTASQDFMQAFGEECMRVREKMENPECTESQTSEAATS